MSEMVIVAGSRSAARQAAWVVSGENEPPQWPLEGSQTYEADPTPAVRERYAEVQNLTEGA